jgi:hypothetical protein
MGFLGPDLERNLPPPTEADIAAAIADVTQDPSRFSTLRYSIRHDR